MRYELRTTVRVSDEWLSVCAICLHTGLNPKGHQAAYALPNLFAAHDNEEPRYKGQAAPAIHDRFHQSGGQRCRPERHQFSYCTRTRASTGELCCRKNSIVYQVHRCATSTCATGDDVTRRGESFLKSG